MSGGHGLVALGLSGKAQLEECLEHDVLEMLGLFPTERNLDVVEVDLIVVAIFLLTCLVIGVKFVHHVTLLVSERRLQNHLESLATIAVELLELLDAALLLVAVGVEDGLGSSKVELVQVLLDSLAPDSTLLTLRLLFGLALLQHIIVAIVGLLENLRFIIVIEVQLR